MLPRCFCHLDYLQSQDGSRNPSSGSRLDVGHQKDNDNENDGHQYVHDNVESHGLVDLDDVCVGEGACRSTSFQ